MALTTVSPALLDITAQYYGFKNKIINGDIKVWQRGTTFNTITNTYNADRWTVTNVGGAVNVTQDTLVPNVQYKYSLKLVPAVTNTYSECAARQWIEQQNVFDLAGQSVMLSAWVYCSKSSVKLRVASTVNATGGADLSQTTPVTAATWTKVTYPSTAFSGVTAWTSTPNSAGAFVDIGFVDGTALTTSDYLYITGVQLEKGTVATSFDYVDYGRQLIQCQRYYYRRNYDQTGNDVLANLHAYAAGAVYGKLIDLPVELRSVPTCSVSSASHFKPTIANSTASTAFTAVNFGQGVNKTQICVGGMSGSSGLVAGNCSVVVAGTTSAWIDASAEL